MQTDTESNDLSELMIVFELDGKFICASPRLSLEASGENYQRALLRACELAIARQIKGTRRPGRPFTGRQSMHLKLTPTARTVLTKLSEESLLSESAVVESLILQQYAHLNPVAEANNLSA